MSQKSNVLNLFRVGYGVDGESPYRSFELPGAKPHYSPDRPGQVEHIFLDLTMDLDRGQCQGICQIRLTPIREGIQHLTLDAVQQDIQEVLIKGQPQRFDYDGQSLQIYPQEPLPAGEAIVIEIHYHLDRPQRGLYFIQPTPADPQKPIQVWTQGEDEDSRYWFPCFDYPGQLATSEIRVKVPAGFQAIANGELIEWCQEGEHRVYHWLQKQIHPTYLMTLVVGKFAQVQDQWQGKPVLYYGDPGREADLQRTLGKTPAMIEFFSQRFGYPYPYPHYTQVCVHDFIFGGMENTSTTLLTDRCLLDERAALDDRRSETLVAHELAHQWFGDLVVIKHWSHAWIKEGMATYSETLWVDQAYGADDAAYYQLQTLRNYLDEDASRYRRPIVTHVYREPIELYDRHLYEKGACVYRLLHHELGDELFWKSIQYFVQTYGHQTVETIDLIRAIETVTGRNLLFIFDQYVFRGGHPEYKVSYSWDDENHLAKVTIRQQQAKPDNKGKDLFDLKIALAFFTPDSSNHDAQKTDSQSQPLEPKRFVVRVHEPEQSFYFSLAQKPEFLSFDPQNAILKTVEFDYPVPLLKAQLQGDPNPVSRIFAASALAKKGGLEALKALQQALTQDRFWGVRAEVAQQIAEIKLDQNVEALVAGLQDKDARVRRATVNALAKLKTPASYEALKTVAAQGDASYGVEADALAALGTFADLNHLNPNGLDPELEILDLLRQALVERSGWNEVVRAGAIRGLSGIKTSSTALDLLLDYCEPGIPQPLRLAAIRALGTIASGQPPAGIDRILSHLGILSQETFFLTQVAVVIALEKIEHPRAIAILHALGDQTTDGRVRLLAEEAIGTVQANLGNQKGIQTLRDDLETLRKENQELRSRLEGLEARSVTPHG
jgi:aminopeptidase N